MCPRLWRIGIGVTLDGNWQFDKRCTHLARMSFPLEARCTFRPSAELKCRFGLECCQPTSGDAIDPKTEIQVGNYQLTATSHQPAAAETRSSWFGIFVFILWFNESAPQSGPHFRCLTTYRLSPGLSLPFHSFPFRPKPRGFPNLCPQSDAPDGHLAGRKCKRQRPGDGTIIKGSGEFDKQMFWSIPN